MKKIFLLIIVILSISCKRDDFKPINSEGLEPKSSGEIIHHTYYTLAYSEADEQAYLFITSS